MQKIGILAFHKFLKNELRVEVLEKYWNYHILSEADLQSVVWHLISTFLSRHDPDGRRFKVLNKPYLRGLRIHPDIVVFRRRKPWVVIELKERKRLSPRSANSERDRLLKSRRLFGARRGYLIYVARYGDEKLIRGRKGAAARFFFEIPIILDTMHSLKSIKKWEADFKFWSKYVSDGQND